MVDAWGRPTLEDGLNIARSAMAVADYKQEKQESAEAKKTRENSFKVAELLKKDPNADLSEYGDEAKFLGAQLKWQAQAEEINANTAKMQQTTEGMNQEVAQMQLRNQKLAQMGQQYQAARASGSDEEAKKIGRQIFNMSPNGLHVARNENGKLTVTGWEGNTQEMDDLSVADYDNRIAALLGMDEQQKVKMQMGNRQMVRQRNYSVMSQAEPMLGPNNEIAYFVPAGSIDPSTGDLLDGFYADADGNQIPEEKVKGFKKMPESLRNFFETAGEMPNQNARSAMAESQAGLAKATTSDLEKKATFLAETYNIPKAEALDKLRTDEQLAQLLKAYNADMTTQTQWLDPEEDKEEIAKIDKDLREKYGLDAYLNKPGGKKTEGEETPPVEGAKKAKDGNWYVQKDGKWYLVENK